MTAKEVHGEMLLLNQSQEIKELGNVIKCVSHLGCLQIGTAFNSIPALDNNSLLLSEAAT